MNKLDYINLTQRENIVGKVFTDYDDLCAILYEDKVKKESGTGKNVKESKEYSKHKQEMFTRIKWKKCENGFVITDYLPLYEYIGNSKKIVYYNEIELETNEEGAYVEKKLEPKILYLDDVDINDFVEAGFDADELF